MCQMPVLSLLSAGVSTRLKRMNDFSVNMASATPRNLTGVAPNTRP